MKYTLNDNIKKAIEEFDELLKNINTQNQKKKIIIKSIKEKLEHAISVIKNK